ncbi:MAG: hypothetical protein IPK60_06660 [Sandaracinaceae bacterium]|jgi:uncharacterized protein with von Willebrand factor type A (vWA) domain|nr:hypothetical protein [Sandaracinaceae bacterium]
MVEPPPFADPVDAAWRAVLGRWDDADAHRRFIHVCMDLGRIADAARRYREIANSEQNRKIDAEKRIQAIVVLATEQLALRTREPRQNSRGLVLWVGFAVSMALLLTALFQYLRAS